VSCDLLRMVEVLAERSLLTLNGTSEEPRCESDEQSRTIEVHGPCVASSRP